jgi:fatty acid synthase subunit beta
MTLDFSVIIAWEALTRPLMIPSLECDFMRLLHQSVDIEQSFGQQALRVGDTLRTISRITGLSTTSQGRNVEVTAEILREDTMVVRIRTAFFVRHGTLQTESPEFKSVQEPEMILSVDSDVREALIKSRRWLHFNRKDLNTSLMGLDLIFRMVSHTTFDDAGNISSVHASGDVYSSNRFTSAEQHVGKIYYDDEERHACNLVMNFLTRHGALSELRHPLEKPGWADEQSASVDISAPMQSRSYAAASGDHNPIHTCAVFARFSGIETTVVHGMNTSAIALRLVSVFRKVNVFTDVFADGLPRIAPYCPRRPLSNPHP